MSMIELGLIIGMWFTLAILIVIRAAEPRIDDYVRCLCCDEQVEPRQINPGTGMCQQCEQSICRLSRHPHIDHHTL